MRRLSDYLSMGGGLALSLSACAAGAGSSVGTIDPAGNPCYVEPDGAPLRDSVALALPGPIRPGGSGLALSPAERFLAAHVGRDSSFFDCTGKATLGAPGRYRIASSEPLILVPTQSGGSGPTILVQATAPGSDPRDLIDRGADVVITSDAAALDYARSRGGLRLIPLAWAITYVLLSSPGTPFPVELTPALRIELARDAVRAEARPAHSLTWRNDGHRCGPPRQPAGPPIAGIAFPEEDATARALAERLVALAGPTGPRRVLAYPPAVLDSALAGGRVMAYVLPLPGFAPLECGGSPPIAPGSAMVPLIDVRATAVLGPGVPPFVVSDDGLIRFVPRRRP